MTYKEIDMKILRRFWLVLIPLVVVIACDNLPDNVRGSIEIHIIDGFEPKTIEPTLTMTIDTYDIVLTGFGTTITKTLESTETTTTIASLQPGTWQVTVNARNSPESGAVIIATDTQEVEVIAGQSTSADFVVVPDSGQGSLHITVGWPSDAVTTPSVMASLTEQGGGDHDISVSFESEVVQETQIAVYSGSWESGYYTLTIRLMDGDSPVWGWVDAVRIISGQTSNAAYTLTEDLINPPDSGEIDIGVAADLQNPLSIDMIGTTAELTIGSDMTVTADTSPAADSYSWFLSGLLLSGETAQSITLGSDLAIGSYSLTVVVEKETTTGTVISSEGIYFSVISESQQIPGSLKWTFSTGDSIYSSAAIGSDGTIYVGSLDGNLYALDPDGTQKWSFNTGSVITASPAIDANGTVYIGSLGSNLYALNPDGTQKWAFSTADTIFSSPAIGADGAVYIGSSDNNLYAVNSDGTQRWVFAANADLDSSPVIALDGTVYIVSREGLLYAITSTGELLWAIQTEFDSYATAAIGLDGTIYVGVNNNIAAIDPIDSTYKWFFGTEDIVHASPAVDSEGIVYVGSFDGKVYAIDPYPEVTVLWIFTTGDRIYSSPSIGADGTIYIGSLDTNVYAINGDGSQKWVYSTEGVIRANPTIGTDGTVYVGSFDGKLYAIAGNPGGIANAPWPMFHQNNSHTGLQAQ
jgi:outer membrane protein assembly factor BamB